MSRGWTSLETGQDFVDKAFIEPAAGHGNILVAILHRRLRAVEKTFPRQDWPEVSLLAPASIYGIEPPFDVDEPNRLEAILSGLGAAAPAQARPPAMPPSNGQWDALWPTVHIGSNYRPAPPN